MYRVEVLCSILPSAAQDDIGTSGVRVHKIYKALEPEIILIEVEFGSQPVTS